MTINEPADRSFTVTWPRDITWHNGFGKTAQGELVSGSTSNGIQVWDLTPDMQQQANQIAAQLSTVTFTSVPPPNSSYSSGTKTLRELVERIDGYERPGDYIQRACELLGQILERRVADERAEQLARRAKTAPLRQRRVIPPTER
jgi:hypothetical protein